MVWGAGDVQGTSTVSQISMPHHALALSAELPLNLTLSDQLPRPFKLFYPLMKYIGSNYLSENEKEWQFKKWQMCT